MFSWQVELIQEGLSCFPPMWRNSERRNHAWMFGQGTLGVLGSENSNSHRRNVRMSPLDKCLFCDFQWAKAFHDPLTSVLLFMFRWLFIFSLWASLKVFPCSFCRSGCDIWPDRTEILHGGVWKAPRRAFFRLPAANTKQWNAADAPLSGASGELWSGRGCFLDLPLMNPVGGSC